VQIDMSVESLIDTYGYLAVVVGTFLEGETVLVLGGFAAHRGYLHLPWVVLAAFIGSLMGDQLFFFLGRWHSQTVLAKRPLWRDRVEKAQNLIGRYRSPFILVFRFLYGLRTVAPFVIGMSNVPVPLFVFLNAVGAIVWAIAVGTGGYLFGNALEIFIGNVKHYELQAFGAIAALGAGIWILYMATRRRRRMLSIKVSQEQKST
jgi:membrane protein DedA with SNARE-associated domain